MTYLIISFSIELEYNVHIYTDIKGLKSIYIWQSNIDVSQCNYIAFIYKAFYDSNEKHVNHRTKYSLKVHLSQHCYCFPALL